MQYLTYKNILKIKRKNINSILKRAKTVVNNQEHVVFFDFIYNFSKGELLKNNTKIALSLTEKTLLEALLKAKGAELSRETLAVLTDNEDNPRVVDVQITRLRKKIETDPKLPNIIKTISRSLITVLN